MIDDCCEPSNWNVSTEREQQPGEGLLPFLLFKPTDAASVEVVLRKYCNRFPSV